jgi:hypothetical protein
MYQKEVASKAEINIDFLEIANEVCDWSITRYGYFVNSTVDVLDLTKAFAEELSRLPSNCLDYIDRAKNKWIDEGHKRPPQMSDFLTALRELNNNELNNKARPRLDHDESAPYSATAHAWDNTEDKDRYEFLKGLRNRKVSAATKWVIGQWMKGKNFDEKRIRSILS